jgi:hypothetical protein
MNSNDFLNEDIVTDANDMHQDHEVQMARQECYHAAERAIAVHKLLRHVNEAEGLEGWVSAKITLANDYLKTVHDYLEYQLMTMNSPAESNVLPIAESQQGVAEGMFTKDPAIDPTIGKQINSIINRLHNHAKQTKDEYLLGTVQELFGILRNTGGTYSPPGSPGVRDVAEDASAGASSSGSVATVVKGGKGGTNLLGGPEYKGPNPFKKKKSK